MESMVEENGSAVDPLSQGSQSGDAAPAIATSVQSIDRTHQQQTHHLVASTSIVQLTLPSSGTTQVYRRLSCVSMSDNLSSLYFGACAYHLFVLYYRYCFSVMQVRFRHPVLHNAGCVLGTQRPSQDHSHPQIVGHWEYTVCECHIVKGIHWAYVLGVCFEFHAK